MASPEFVEQDRFYPCPNPIPVARIDFLSSNGIVGDSMEYHSEAAFLKALKEELH